MGVTGEIAQHLLWPCERRLAVDPPLDSPQRGDEALECSLIGKSGMGVEELQRAGVMRLHEHRQHLAAEQARQYVDMNEEVGARGNPSRIVEREPSTRSDFVRWPEAAIAGSLLFRRCQGTSRHLAKGR